MTKLAGEFLLPPQILHPWLSVRDEPGPAITLGMRRELVYRLIVCCRGRGDQVEPNPVELVERHGADTPVLDWPHRV
jgi:hypothetical protein